MPDSPGLGEQALNKAAEVGLSSQLDAVENLDVNIQTDPFKLLQGEVDAVTIQGEGLVMQKDLRMQELEMHAGSVAINPLSAAFGKIELTKPTKGTARVILTEKDINHAFNSEYVRAQLQEEKVQMNGKSMTVIPQEVDFQLPGNNRVRLNANVILKENNEHHKVAFSAVPKIGLNGQTVSLENVEYEDTQEISPDLTKSLIDATGKILNLSNFDLEEMTLRIQQLEALRGQLIIQAEAFVEKIPTE